ncbi:hypothetical protein CsatB_007393 [Cannabis sativa]
MAAIALDMTTQEWHEICSSGEGTSTLDAEIKAMALAMQWAIDMNWSSITLLADCLVAVNALKAKTLPDWKLAAVFFKAIDLAKSFNVCSFLHVTHDCITGVNDLAVQARVLRVVNSFTVGDGLPPVNPIFFP